MDCHQKGQLSRCAWTQSIIRWLNLRFITTRRKSHKCGQEGGTRSFVYLSRWKLSDFLILADVHFLYILLRLYIQIRNSIKKFLSRKASPFWLFHKWPWYFIGLQFVFKFCTNIFWPVITVLGRLNTVIFHFEWRCCWLSTKVLFVFSLYDLPLPFW